MKGTILKMNDEAGIFSRTEISANSQVSIGLTGVHYKLSMKYLFLLLVVTLNLNNLFAQSGEIDLTFNPLDNSSSSGMGATPSFISTISEQQDKKLIIAGNFTQYNGLPRDRVARINPDGSLDTGFYPRIPNNWYFFSSAIQEDGKILIGGATPKLIRINTNGEIDTSFSPEISGFGWVRSIHILPEGKILIADGTTLYKLLPNGQFDPSFFSQITGASKFAVQPDGRILICGDLNDGITPKRLSVRRLNPNGAIDTSFRFIGEANWEFGDIKIQKDGKIIVGGGFSSINGVERNRIARLHSNGTVDLSFNPAFGFNNNVITIEIQKDGKILCGGFFTNLNGAWMSKLARLNTNGSRDFSFNPGSGANGDVQDIHIQSDEKIVIAGDFTSFNSNSKNRIARIFNLIGCASDSIAKDTMVCFSYFWPVTNETYTQSGVYSKRYQNSANCDSVIVLFLTINPTPNTSSIAGNSTVSILETTSYSVTGLSGSTFNWNVQGASIEAGLGTNTIKVKWQTMGAQQITVTETSNKGCIGVQKTLSVNVGPATGIMEFGTNDNIEIYPNPTTGNVNMKVDAKLIGSNYAVIDILGKTVVAGTIKTNEEILNLENVSAGIYFISFGDNSNKTFKIIKE